MQKVLTKGKGKNIAFLASTVFKLFLFYNTCRIADQRAIICGYIWNLLAVNGAISLDTIFHDLLTTTKSKEIGIQNINEFTAHIIATQHIQLSEKTSLERSYMYNDPILTQKYV